MKIKLSKVKVSRPVMISLMLSIRMGTTKMGFKSSPNITFCIRNKMWYKPLYDLISEKTTKYKIENQKITYWGTYYALKQNQKVKNTII